MELLWYDYLTLLVAAFVAGAVNAVAGGGTLLTFPALLWAHQTEIVANATSTVALWPGQLSSLWGYRKEIASSPRAIGVLAVPSLLGGLIGSLLLVRTDNATFAVIVPYLILGATLLFTVQEPLARWQRHRAAQSHADHAAATANLLVDSGHYPMHRCWPSSHSNWWWPSTEVTSAPESVSSCWPPSGSSA